MIHDISMSLAIVIFVIILILAAFFLGRYIGRTDEEYRTAHRILLPGSPSKTILLKEPHPLKEGDEIPGLITMIHIEENGDIQARLTHLFPSLHALPLEKDHQYIGLKEPQLTASPHRLHLTSDQIDQKFETEASMKDHKPVKHDINVSIIPTLTIGIISILALLHAW